MPPFSLDFHDILKSILHYLSIKIKEYMSHQPILRAWIFGSYSRGEERSDSDIDILVDYDNSHGRVSLFTMGGILML